VLLRQRFMRSPARRSCTPRWDLVDEPLPPATSDDRTSDTATTIATWESLVANNSTQAWSDAIMANQFPSSCQRMLLVEDDLQAQGLGMTAEYLALALLLALRERRVLAEVPVDPSWNPTCAPPWDDPRPLPKWVQQLIPPGKTLQQIPKHLLDGWRVEPLRCAGRPTCTYPCAPANLSRQYHSSGSFAHPPATRPRWCTRPPFTHECFYQPWTGCAIPPPSTHVPPHLGRAQDIRIHHVMHHNTSRVLRIS
jgi:hypothetical protein